MQYIFYMLTIKAIAYFPLLSLCAELCILAHNTARRATHAKEAAAINREKGSGGRPRGSSPEGLESFEHKIAAFPADYPKVWPFPTKSLAASTITDKKLCFSQMFVLGWRKGC